MSDPLFDELPILRELGNDLKDSFRSHEATARRHSWPAHRPPRRLLGPGGIAAVAAGFTVAFVFGIQGGSPTPPGATAALLRAAAVAVRHPGPFPTDTQFYYLRYVSTGLAVVRAEPTSPLAIDQFRTSPKVFVTVEGELWSSATRPGVNKSAMLTAKFETAAGRWLWERIGRPSFLPSRAPAMIEQPGKGHYLLGNIALTRRQLLATSTDPRRLYRRLYAAGGSPAEVFTEIGDTLRNRPLPATLSSALYRALALVPGVRLLGPVHDSLGRRAIAVAFVHAGVEEELIFDPTSSEMLAERTTVLAGAGRRFGLPDGTVLSTTTYLERSITSSAIAP